MRLFLSLALLAMPALAAVSLDDGYRELYNLDFGAAHQIFADYARSQPEDPMGPASEAAACLFQELDRLHILQSEFFLHDQHFATDHRLTPDPQLKQRFDAALDEAARVAARDPNGRNAMLAGVLRSGLRSDYMALIEKRYVPSLREMQAGRDLAERLVARYPDMADAYLAIGVENYMLSLKPAPLRFLLRLSGARTDRETGLAKLRITAEKGRYLAPFANLMLAVAALRDGNSKKAEEILNRLTRDYPRNPLYAQELARLHRQEARL
jgi:Tetratricopeptide repeat